MKNILKIFIDDVKRIRKNVIAMIVVIGVLVVPCMHGLILRQAGTRITIREI